jgi:CO/xanthine dehydrogenase Mo-binding subunit
MPAGTRCPSGTHAVEVEIDTETGEASVDQYGQVLQ